MRPGRSTLLPVLANDSDPDGDVLTASAQDPGTGVSVSSAQGGLALRLDAPAEATGTFTVPYSADDGRGMNDSAVATVEVHGWDVNAAPEQTTTPTWPPRPGCMTGSPRRTCTSMTAGCG